MKIDKTIETIKRITVPGLQQALKDADALCRDLEAQAKQNSTNPASPDFGRASSFTLVILDGEIVIQKRQARVKSDRELEAEAEALAARPEVSRGMRQVQEAHRANVDRIERSGKSI